MTLKELVKEDINDLPDFAVGAFRVDRQWLASMNVKPNAATADELIRADRDSRG